MGKRDESYLLPKLKNLRSFCEKKMASSLDINDFEEWNTIKERIDLWIESAESY